MKYRIQIIIALLFVACSSPKPRKPVLRKTTTFMEESIARNKSINKTEEDFFKNKIKKDTLNKYYNSENGFWYFYNKKGNQNLNFPKKGDEVVINYEIKDINNTIIYSREELGSKDQKIKGDRTYRIDAEEFITGVREGIKLMHIGDEITFLFPSNKVLGASGFQDRIKPNQPLIITVFLKKIKQIKLK